MPVINAVPLTAKISTISAGGEVSIIFSEEVQIPANISEIDTSMLRLTAIPNQDSVPEDLKFEWKTESMTSRILKLSIEFATPLKVSSVVNNISFKVLVQRHFADRFYIEYLVQDKEWIHLFEKWV